MSQIIEQYLDDALKARDESASRLRRVLNHLEEAENKIAELTAIIAEYERTLFNIEDKLRRTRWQ